MAKKTSFSKPGQGAKDIVNEVTESDKEKTVRFNVDMPFTVHSAMKVHCAKTGQKMSAYVLDLIKKDLSSKAQ